MNMPQIAMMWEDGADTSFGLPSYETDGAAGADIRANLPDKEAMILPAGARALIPTGLRLAIPQGFEAQLRPRSGLALKHGITLPNAPGTIDSDYRGPLGVILLNTGSGNVLINHGDRIAQMVIAPVVQGNFVETDNLPPTVRGVGGFGSTGVS